MSALTVKVSVHNCSFTIEIIGPVFQSGFKLPDTGAVVNEVVS